MDQSTSEDPSRHRMERQGSRRGQWRQQHDDDSSPMAVQRNAAETLMRVDPAQRTVARQQSRVPCSRPPSSGPAPIRAHSAASRVKERRQRRRSLEPFDHSSLAVAHRRLSHSRSKPQEPDLVEGSGVRVPGTECETANHGAFAKFQMQMMQWEEQQQLLNEVDRGLVHVYHAMEQLEQDESGPDILGRFMSKVRPRTKPRESP